MVAIFWYLSVSIYFLGLEKELLKAHEALEKSSDNSIGVIKRAFDTRRINTETEVNPRRNLQNYQRSEPFINPEVSNKIPLLFKIKNAADQIKEDFIGDPDWLDSNTRILCNALNNTLRIEQKDYDFFKPQFDYIDQLLYLRYRLNTDDIQKMNELEIKNVILGRDERLLHKTIFSQYKNDSKTIKTSEKPNTIQEIHKHTSYVQEDSLMEKLFGGVKASKDNKNVKRSINITISDSINDGEENKEKGE